MSTQFGEKNEILTDVIILGNGWLPMK